MDSLPAPPHMENGYFGIRVGNDESHQPHNVLRSSFSGVLPLGVWFSPLGGKRQQTICAATRRGLSADTDVRREDDSRGGLSRNASGRLSSTYATRFGPHARDPEGSKLHSSETRDDSMLFVEDRHEHSVFILRQEIRFGTDGSFAPLPSHSSTCSKCLDVNWNHHWVHHAGAPQRFSVAYKTPNTQHRVLARFGWSLFRVDPNLAYLPKSQSLIPGRN